MTSTFRLLLGDAETEIAKLDSASVDCIVTSPPYYWQRAYDVDNEIGREETPSLYVERLRAVFAECQRVLRKDGTFWLNVADSFNNRVVARPSSHHPGLRKADVERESWTDLRARGCARLSVDEDGLKEKDLMGLPGWLARTLRHDGWFHRAEIVWAKTYGNPDGRAHDRPSRRHEII